MKPIRIFIINLLILLFLILVFEIFSGRLIFNKNKLDCTYLLCDRDLIFKNVLLHNNYSKYDVIYSRDKFGLRGRKKSLDNIDILTVGGSTTDERYLKLEDTWSEKLETKLKKIYPNLDVVNAGVDGQSTNGHLWNFSNWFNKLENFKPKYIIFYIGNNERLYQNVEAYKNSNFYDNNVNVSSLNIFKKIKYYIKKNNGIIYRGYILVYRKFFLKDHHQVSHNPLRKTMQYLQPTKKIEINNLTKQMFTNNLKKLVEHSKSLNSISIFITQRTSRWQKKNEFIFSISEKDFYNYEKTVSKIIMSFCIENEIFCVDLNKNLNLKFSDTYDLVHYTPKGSDKVSDNIFEGIKNYINPQLFNRQP